MLEPYVPQFGFDTFCKKKYYNNQLEREAWGVPSISYEKFVEENEDWLREDYEHFLSIG